MTPTPSIQLTVPKGWNAERHARYSRVFNRPWHERLQSGFVMACIIACAVIAAAWIGAAQADDGRCNTIYPTQETSVAHTQDRS